MPTLASMNWLVVHPEAFLLAAVCVIALVDLWSADPRRRTTTVLTQAAVGVYGAMHLLALDAGVTLYGMQGLMVADPMGHLLALFAAIATMVSLAYAEPYLADRQMLQGEFFTLSLLTLLGVGVMCSANHFLVLYLGLEIMSLSLYALTALRRDHGVATEAAMKYFVLGALASGFLLYGMSMMYGATRSLSIPEVFSAISSGRIAPGVMTLGIVFVVAGLAFKLGVVPFHMWIPDVYHGAPTAVTLLIGGAPKLAAFAVTVRLLVEGMLGIAVQWQQMLLLLAVASLVIGNLAAIAQSNLKRLLAYSTIAQMGFMLLGLASGVVNGNTLSAVNAYSSALFYVVSYVVTTLGTFGLILYLARDGFESEEVADLAGLAKRRPWLAGVMTILMFSLAGVPPTVGFYAKLAVVQAMVTTNVPLYIGVAVAAMVLSLIAAYYYLRIVKVMWFDPPAEGAAFAPREPGLSALLALNGLVVLGLGILPGGLMAICRDAILRTLAS